VLQVVHASLSPVDSFAAMDGNFSILNAVFHDRRQELVVAAEDETIKVESPCHQLPFMHFIF
jgi:hypothetical protein